MTRLYYILGIVVIALSAYGLFHVKYKVKNLKQDLVEVNRQIAMEKKSIHVLKAEWAYLSQPSRIKQLSDNYLSLQYVVAEQIRNEYEEAPSYFAKKDGHETDTPTLRPILSSARGYR